MSHRALPLTSLLVPSKKTYFTLAHLIVGVFNIVRYSNLLAPSLSGNERLPGDYKKYAIDLVIILYPLRWAFNTIA